MLFEDQEREPKEIKIKAGVEAMVREYWDLAYPQLKDYFDFDRALEQLIAVGVAQVRSVFVPPVLTQEPNQGAYEEYQTPLDRFANE